MDTVRPGLGRSSKRQLLALTASWELTSKEAPQSYLRTTVGNLKRESRKERPARSQNYELFGGCSRRVSESQLPHLWILQPNSTHNTIPEWNTKFHVRSFFTVTAFNPALPIDILLSHIHGLPVLGPLYLATHSTLLMKLTIFGQVLLSHCMGHQLVNVSK